VRIYFQGEYLIDSKSWPGLWTSGRQSRKNLNTNGRQKRQTEKQTNRHVCCTGNTHEQAWDKNVTDRQTDIIMIIDIQTAYWTYYGYKETTARNLSKVVYAKLIKL